MRALRRLPFLPECEMRALRRLPILPENEISPRSTRSDTEEDWRRRLPILPQIGVRLPILSQCAIGLPAPRGVCGERESGRPDVSARQKEGHVSGLEPDGMVTWQHAL